MRSSTLAALSVLVAGCSMAIAPLGADPGSGRAPNAFWPPPQASGVTEDAPLADEALGEAAERLERMLRGAGHLALRRYPIGARYEHGFVLTTRLERIHEDGSIVASSARWSDLYPAPANLRWLEGADALRLPGPGRYRALLVAFTDLPVVAKDRPSGWDSATLMESIDEPPPLPASRRVRARPGYRVVSFVYEYQSTRADGIGRRLGLR